RRGMSKSASVDGPSSELTRSTAGPVRRTGFRSYSTTPRWSSAVLASAFDQPERGGTGQVPDPGRPLAHTRRWRVDTSPLPAADTVRKAAVTVTLRPDPGG